MKVAKKFWNGEEWLATVFEVNPPRIISSDREIGNEDDFFKNLPPFPFNRKRTTFQDNPEEWARHFERRVYTYSRVEIIEE